MVRQFITILILGCLLVYMGGYQLVYLGYRAEIKQDMRAYLKNHKDIAMGDYLSFRIQNQTIQADGFNWEETGREFSYLGSMYDVVTIHYAADSVYICALRDSRENKLSDQLTTLHKNSLDHHTAVISLIKMFSVFTEVNAPVICREYPLTSPVHAVCPENTIYPVGPEVQTPPPRHAI